MDLGTVWTVLQTSVAQAPEAVEKAAAASVDIVKAARGEIIVQSTPGAGTEFEVKLPVTEI